MMKPTLFALGLLGLLSGCQQQTAPVATVQPATTEAQARQAVQRYVQAQPNANLYLTDSASVLEVDNHWQVLVPRRDWADRMPNRAAFEVDKQTGEVSGMPVK